MIHKKKDIENQTKKAINKLNQKKKTDSRIVQHQSGDIINVNNAGDGDIYMFDEVCKTEVKYLKKLIKAKDEEILMLKDIIKTIKHKETET